jgi:hypothetical protein
LAQDAAQEHPSSPRQSPDWLEKQWTGAHNQWQRTPVDIAKQADTVSSDVRAQRNAYWMQIPQRWALGAAANGLMPGPTIHVPEVGEIKGAESVWVAATFEAFHVFAIDPGSTLIYTEENMRVIDVIESPDDVHISAGSLLDVQIAGGALRTAQGTVHISGVDPRPLAPQLGHTYLLHLLYEPHSGTMTTGQRWELSSGALQPDDESEFRRAQEGNAVLAGKSIDEARKYIQSTLRAQNGR